MHIYTFCTKYLIVSGNSMARFIRDYQTGNFLSQYMAEIPSLKGLKYQKIIVIEISW